MDQKKSIIITILALVFILTVIGATVVFLVRGIRSRQTNSPTLFTRPSAAPTVSSEPLTFSLPNPTNSSVLTPPTPSDSNRPALSPSPGTAKTYAGTGFSLRYPRAWGLLTCSNTSHFELDPYNATDQRIVCNESVKPTTVLVGVTTNCSGETVTLGGITVVRSKEVKGTETDYRWCTKTTPVLDITHRVAPTGGSPFSRDDFSVQVEQVIQSLRFGT